MIKILLLILGLAYASQGKVGFSIILPNPVSVFQCMTRYNASYVNVGAFLPTGYYNTAAESLLRQGISVGLATDIYMYNCAGKDPIDQVRALMTALPNTLYTRIWIAVVNNTQSGCSWATNTPQKNCQYLKGLVSAAQSSGKQVGIVSSYSDWYNAFKSVEACPDLSNLPLWFLSRDGQKGLTNFTPFGGWTTPSQKSYDVFEGCCTPALTINYQP